MRSEGNDAVVDCDDPMTVIACTTDTDACPAACRESDEPVVVKAGDLTVTAKATEGRRAIMPGVSDLDTLTFRTSEDVTISKVVLERYGYSSQDDVDEVRLEDQDGNVIAEGKSLSKDKVTLSIKKDYRNVDGTYYATVVARLTGNNVGGTIGFKVVDADSTAKNLNLDNYTPYTYEMVSYSGATVEVDLKGTQDKNYNYVEGESYEIARLKVTAGNAIIYVKGFTLTNGSGLDMADFLDKLSVKVDGEEVDGLKYSINKDEQLVVSFDELTIDMNKSKLFVISATLEDFDDYGKAVAYYLASTSDFNAVEKKTGARLDVQGQWGKAYAVRHAFNGGKIKLSNNKLGKIDASQGSEGVAVAEGTITVTEPISKLGFTIEAKGTGAAYVTRMAMFVDGEEFEAKKSGTSFAFSNVEIEKSGKVQFKIDIEDKNEAQEKVITFEPNFNGDLFANARYDNSRDDVNPSDVAGTISFSQVTIKAASATFKNSLSKAVEYMNQDTNDGVVFDGTYTAKKANINLNKFYMSGDANPNKVKVTYYLYIEGKEVASVDAYGTGAEEQFDDVVVKAGESVKVRVVAEVEAYGTAPETLANRYVVLGGTDDFDKDVEYKAAKLMDMKIVEKGSVNIQAGAVAKTVLQKAKNQVLAQFTVRPADGSSSVEIEEISFSLTASGDAVNSDDISVMFGDNELEATNTTSFVYEDINITIKDPVTVKVILDEEKAGTITLSGITVNTKTLNKEYVSRFEDAVVRIAAQKDLGGGTTKFTFSVDKDSSVTVSDLELTLEGGLSGKVAGEIDSNSFLEVINGSDTAQMVTVIKYTVFNEDDYVAAHCDNGTNEDQTTCETAVAVHTGANWVVAACSS